MLRKISFVLLVCTAAVAFYAGCSDRTGDGVTPPPPPSEQDKIVFGNRIISEATGKEIIHTRPVIAQPNLMDAMVASRLSEQTFKVTSLVDKTAYDISQKFNSPNIKGLGLAPNGDFWYYTKYGLFISNVNIPSEEREARPEPLISSQDLATSFLEGVKDSEGNFNGYYNVISPISRILFLKHPDEKDQYWALGDYTIVVDRNDFLEPKEYSVLLLYNSKDKSFRKLLPFDLALQARSGEDEYIDASLDFYMAENIRDDDGFYYILSGRDISITSAASSSAAVYPWIRIKYDPVTDKHYFLHSYQSDYSYYAKYDYFLKSKVRRLEIDIDACLDENQEASDVEKCLLESIKDKKISIYRGKLGELDITDKLISKSNAFQLLQNTKVDFDLKEIASIPFLNIKRLKVSDLYANVLFDREDTEVTELDISLNALPPSSTAAPAETESIYPFESIYIPRPQYYIGKDKIYYVGENLNEDEEIVPALYSHTMEGNESKLILEGNRNTEHFDIISFIKESPNLGALLLVRLKEPDSDYDYKIYSEAKEKIVEIKLENHKLVPHTFNQLYLGNVSEQVGLTLDTQKLLLYVYRENTDNETEMSHGNYFVSAAQLFEGDGLTIDKLTQLVDDEYIETQFVWKDFLIWSTSHEGEDKSYMGVITEDPEFELITDSAVGYSDVFAGTVAKFTPPETELSLSVSADLTDKFNCAAEGKMNKWCPNPGEMCQNGECVAINLTQCTTDSDCNTFGLDKFCNSINKCRERICSTNANCPIGSRCSVGKCTREGMQPDQCRDGHCAAGFECLLDEEKGYTICKAEEALCEVDEDCAEEGANFLCDQSGICLPEMVAGDIVNISQEGTSIKPESVRFKYHVEFKPVSKYSGEMVTEYRLVATNKALLQVVDDNYIDFGEEDRRHNQQGFSIPSAYGVSDFQISDNYTSGNETASLIFDISGDKGSTEVAFIVCPIMGASHSQKHCAGQIKTVTQNGHCMLGDAGQGECPEPSSIGIRISIPYEYECENRECVKKYKKLEPKPDLPDGIMDELKRDFTRPELIRPDLSAPEYDMTLPPERNIDRIE